MPVAATELGRILAADQLRMRFQPIVELETGAVVGYEALVRGPKGLRERPDLLFAAARREGRVPELDWACRHAALRGALAGGLRPPHALYVNAHPEALEAERPAAYAETFAAAAGVLDLTLELPESALTGPLPGILDAIAAARAEGWRIAIDDLGSDLRALELVRALRPDVLKLDAHVTQRRFHSAAARIARFVRDYAEDSGATVLAEGLETEEQVERARALGARLGQGFLFGRPEALAAAEGALRLPHDFTHRPEPANH
jgi:EAL domain-containing protein (putative c-di-GMP-specific phosphodiesterase class I)